MIEFPPIPGDGVPRWVGPGFEVGGRRKEVLEYSSDTAGWDDELTAMHESEAGQGSHPIDVESRRRALAALKHCKFPERGAVLEVGCSSGFLIPELRAAFPGATIVGADVVSAPLVRLARIHRDVAFVRMNLLECVLSDASFDAVVALNVLEHISEDERAVEAIHRVLRPGGIFVVEVPQGPALFDSYDRALRHFRRYSVGGLQHLLTGAGFEIETQSHIGFSIYPAFVLTKLIGRMRARKPNRERKRTEERIRASRESALLEASLRLDRLLERLGSLPTGIRAVAVGRKPRRC